jgi:hypothetical protein
MKAAAAHSSTPPPGSFEIYHEIAELDSTVTPFQLFGTNIELTLVAAQQDTCRPFIDSTSKVFRNPPGHHRRSTLPFQEFPMGAETLRIFSFRG